MKLLKYKYLLAVSVLTLSVVAVVTAPTTLAATSCDISKATCKAKYVTECKKNYKEGFCDTLTNKLITACAGDTGTTLVISCMKAAENVYTASTDAEARQDAAENSIGGDTQKENDCKAPDYKSLSKDNCNIIKIITVTTKALSSIAGLVIIAVIIVGGIQYSASGADPSKVQAAKQKISNALLALMLLIFGFAILQWLVPGGIF